MRVRLLWLAILGAGAPLVAQNTTPLYGNQSAIYSNDPTVGTVLYATVKPSPTGALTGGTSDTNNIIGIAVEGAGTTGYVAVAQLGTAPANFDAANPVFGHYVTVSTTVAGTLHDAGATKPSGVEILGTVAIPLGSQTQVSLAIEHASITTPTQAVGPAGAIQYTDGSGNFQGSANATVTSGGAVAATTVTANQGVMLGTGITAQPTLNVQGSTASGISNRPIIATDSNPNGGIVVQFFNPFLITGDYEVFEPVGMNGSRTACIEYLAGTSVSSDLVYMGNGTHCTALEFDPSGNVIVNTTLTLPNLTSARAIGTTSSGLVGQAAVAGVGAALVSGPTTSIINDLPLYSGTDGTTADSLVQISSLAPKASPTFTGTATFGGTTAMLNLAASGSVTVGSTETVASSFTAQQKLTAGTRLTTITGTWPNTGNTITVSTGTGIVAGMIAFDTTTPGNLPVPAYVQNTYTTGSTTVPLVTAAGGSTAITLTTAATNDAMIFVNSSQSLFLGSSVGTPPVMIGDDNPGAATPLKAFCTNAATSCTMQVGESSGTAGNAANVQWVGSTATPTTNTLKVGLNGVADLIIDYTGDLSIPGHLNQPLTNKYAGVCTMAASTTCTATISAAFNSTPICIVSPQASYSGATVPFCALSGTTVTVTAASNSIQWGYLLIGNPN